MNSKQFAELLSVPPTTVAYWKSRGWLVLRADGSIDAVASRESVRVARGGTLAPMSARQKSRRSHWGRGPHCETHNAFANYREWREDGRRG
jgi:hypothetical protein